MFKEEVGRKIKKLRNERGLSQEELANEAGLDRTYITYVENAKKNVTIETLYKITKALGVSLKDFFDFDESKITITPKKAITLCINDLKIDDIYTNEELSSIFKCSTQGGMRVSTKNKTVTLINQDKGKFNPYKDSSINLDNTFIYTGMGLSGDQVVTETNQNGKVAFSETNGYTLYYFVGLEKNKYQYKGIVKLNGDYFFQDESDSSGSIRKVVKFPLIIDKK